MNGQAEIFLDIGVGIASVISGVLDPIFQLVTSSSK